MHPALALAIDVLSWAALLGGGAMCVIGGIGVLRLPDVYTRMHAASLIDTGGVFLIMLGLALQAGLSMVTVKLAIIVAFLLFTGPITTHALAAAALHEGIKPDEGATPRGGEPSKT